MNGKTNSKTNVTLFRSFTNAVPEGLPRGIISPHYLNDLKESHNVETPFTMYDQWAMALNGIDLAQTFFNGQATNCELLQIATENDRRILDGLSAICRDHMERNYFSSRAAVVNWLRFQGAPIDETTFDKEKRY